ncbi:hypothetical protein PTKIN_Ptkin19aG0051900 [Pterospermum kingtungense]
MSAIRFDSTRQYYATSSLVVGYALCSSLLAIINKFAITRFNYLGLLTALQYLTSALGVWVLGKFGFLHHDPFTLDVAKKFLPAAIVFYLAIFTNTNLLRHANVDTFIVFRSLTPLLVAIADTAFRRQPCPTKLTFMSLLISLGGAVGEVFAALGANAGNWFEPVVFTAVCLSCLFGLLISFFGFATRRAISATAFTVTGVVNKFFIVLINVSIWVKHATPIGLVCLLFTLAGGVLYQQSVSGPPRESAASKQTGDENENDDKENQDKSVSGKHASV